MRRHFAIHRRNEARAAIEERHFRAQCVTDSRKLDTHRTTAGDNDVLRNAATVQDGVRVADTWNLE